MVRSLILVLFASVQCALTVTVEGQLSSKFAHMDVEAYSSVEVQLDNGYKVGYDDSIIVNKGFFRASCKATALSLSTMLNLEAIFSKFYLKN